MRHCEERSDAAICKMNMKRIVILLVTMVTALSVAAQDYIFNRTPLAATDFAELPIGAIRPEGWLHDQLVRQAEGFTGHLDEVYREVVGPDNAWIGGEGDT